MNILPHKSWHVRTKQNIARVRRDEEKAAKEEEERLRRVNLAEHEARIEILRSKNGHLRQATPPVTPKDDTASETFNLFDNIKDCTAKASEKDAEGKVEQEKWEVKAGIFSYLDGRYKHENPEEWYLRSAKDRLSFGPAPTATQLKDDRVKDRHDPLKDIKRNLAVIEKLESRPKEASSSDPATNRTTLKRSLPETRPTSHLEIKRELPEASPRHERRSKKSKKHKKKSKNHKSKRKRKCKSKQRSSSSESESSSSDDESQSTKSKVSESLLNKLRQERLEREKRERLRTQVLLEGPTKSGPTEPVHPSKQRYNSQFNPNIAKQNQSI